MTDITPTTVAISRLDNSGFSQEFLMHVSKYSDNLLGEARKGYISFMGPTLDALVALAELHDVLLDDPRVKVSPVDFLETHVNDDNVYGAKVVGVLWADGYMSTNAVIELAQKTDVIVTPLGHGVKDLGYNPSRLSPMVPALKIGAKQVW